jgi:hypothetical protein
MELILAARGQKEREALDCVMPYIPETFEFSGANKKTVIKILVGRGFDVRLDLSARVEV